MAVQLPMDGLVGPDAYRNWRAQIEGHVARSISEYPLYSDSRFIGEVRDLGPCSLIIVAHHVGRPFAPTEPALVLRISTHLDSHVEISHQIKRPDGAGGYHGGTISDEVAALISLLHGIRLRSASASREYFRADDAIGRPTAIPAEAVPQLALPRYGSMLPGIGREVRLDVSLLRTYPTLHPASAIALLRAARFYQDAVWIADAEPSLSWLFLVSAVEVVAHRWWQGGLEPMDLLRKSKPSLAELCRGAGGTEHERDVAGLLAETLGATKKFLDFLGTHCPDAPSARPTAQAARVDWEPRSLRRGFGELYKHRSKALHAGVPFPAPLCAPPMRLDAGAPDERPSYSAAWAQGGGWRSEDMPMHLHVFERIVRLSIVRWWSAELA